MNDKIRTAEEVWDMRVKVHNAVGINPAYRERTQGLGVMTSSEANKFLNDLEELCRVTIPDETASEFFRAGNKPYNPRTDEPINYIGSIPIEGLGIIANKILDLR